MRERKQGRRQKNSFRKELHYSAIISPVNFAMNRTQLLITLNYFHFTILSATAGTDNPVQGNAQPKEGRGRNGKGAVRVQRSL